MKVERICIDWYTLPAILVRLVAIKVALKSKSAEAFQKFLGMTACSYTSLI